MTIVEYSYYCFVIAASGVLGAYCFVSHVYKASGPRPNLRNVPAIGPFDFLSNLGARRFLFRSRAIQEGYNKLAFRTPLFTSWMTIVSSPNVMGLSNLDDMKEINYSVGIDVHGDPHHFGVIQRSLRRDLGERFDDLTDEIVAAFSDLIPISDDWVKVPAHSTITRIICRTCNRLFVDLPICRNFEFLTLSEYFSTDLLRAVHMIGVFPSFLKSFVGYYLTSVPGNLSCGMRILGLLLEERLEMEVKYGPNLISQSDDLVSWLLEEAEGSQRSVCDLTLHILLINSVVINTVGMAASEVLFDLAAYPSCIAELREEVESIITKKGINKESLAMMLKLDNFVKESCKVHTVCGLTMVAYMLKLMIAYVLLNYDVKLDGAIHPEGERFMQMGFVSPKTVMFRQRAF